MVIPEYDICDCGIRGPHGECKITKENTSAGMVGYVAITTEQHPLTGDAVPILKKLTRDTTVGEIIDWYHDQHRYDGSIYDLRISQAT